MQNHNTYTVLIYVAAPTNIGEKGVLLQSGNKISRSDHLIAAEPLTTGGMHFQNRLVTVLALYHGLGRG